MDQIFIFIEKKKKKSFIISRINYIYIYIYVPFMWTKNGIYIWFIYIHLSCIICIYFINIYFSQFTRCVSYYSLFIWNRIFFPFFSHKIYIFVTYVYIHFYLFIYFCVLMYFMHIWLFKFKIWNIFSKLKKKLKKKKVLLWIYT